MNTDEDSKKMNATILVIEDDADMRDNAKELLELSNYNVVTAANGKEGLELAQANYPDLILCDVMMPELNGYAVLRAIQNIPDLANTPFIFLTAKSGKADFREGMDLGADDYLTKPFDGNELLHVISKRLSKRSSLKKNFSRTIEGLNEFIKDVKSMGDLINLSNGQQHRKVRKKETVFMYDDIPNFLYFIIHGKIKTYRTNYWGKEYITQIYKEGDFFGYNSLLEGKNQMETAVAIEDCELALIPKQDFFQLLYSNQDISMTFIRMLTDNLVEAEEKLINLAYNSARKKVAEALISLSKTYSKEGKRELTFPIYRENVSSIAGLTPESVSRNLSDFRNEGLIETDGGTVTIKEFTKLENLK